MSESNSNSAEGTIDGVRKEGEMYTFTVSVPLQFAGTLKAGEAVLVAGTPVQLTEVDDEYLSFEIQLEVLQAATLCEMNVGSLVVVAANC